MNKKITISPPEDELVQEIVEEIVGNREWTNDNEIEIQVQQNANFGPEFMEIFLVGVGTGIAANSIYDFANYLVNLIRKKRYHGSQLQLIVDNKAYNLPQDIDVLKKYLDSKNG